MRIWVRRSTCHFSDNHLIRKDLGHLRSSAVDSKGNVYSTLPVGPDFNVFFSGIVMNVHPMYIFTLTEQRIPKPFYFSYVPQRLPPLYFVKCVHSSLLILNKLKHYSKIKLAVLYEKFSCLWAVKSKWGKYLEGTFV